MNKIMRRELYSLFTSPIAYIVIALFLLISGLLFFPTFFLYNRAEMRSFFQIIPILFSFFVPAVTMRSFAEERSRGTFEALVTLPMSPARIVAGKYLAVLAFLGLMLLPTLSYPVLIALLGPLDPGPMAGGYIGTMLLAAAYGSIGLFASSMTRNQIVAFIITAAVTLLFTFLDQMLILVPPFLVNTVEFLGTQYHFNTISRGILDTRSIIYLASLAALFFMGTVKAVEERR